jgi:hypothetical protein
MTTLDTKPKIRSFLEHQELDHEDVDSFHSPEHSTKFLWRRGVRRCDRSYGSTTGQRQLDIFRNRFLRLRNRRRGGWEKYADVWQVRSSSNEDELNVVGTRKILYPHVNDQPSTGSLSEVGW